MFVGFTCSCMCLCEQVCMYGVATISKLLKITGLFCKTALEKRLYSAKETYNLIRYSLYTKETQTVLYGPARIGRLLQIIGLFCRI